MSDGFRAVLNLSVRLMKIHHVTPITL